MESFLKRKSTNDADNTKRLKRENCPHAERCYRRNPHHFKEFDHPHLLKMMENNDKIPSDLPQDKQIYLDQLAILRPLLSTNNKQESLINHPSTSGSTDHNRKIENNTKNNGTMLEKLKRNEPYCLFFTTIPKSMETVNQQNSITFTDLLCPSLGDLKCSLQINFMIDIAWLIQQYKTRNLHTKPLTILYGDDWPDMKEYIERFLPNVTQQFIKMKDPFGTHHSKIGIYMYNDESLRVIVSTANLYYEDWNNYNQGLWISPLCRKLPASGGEHDGESPTGFKISLINYLKHYNLDCLKQWIDCVKNVDFSDIRVFLITSVPGRHLPKDPGSHLHRVADLLLRHCELPPKQQQQQQEQENGGESGPLSWPILAQSSSIGSLGKQPGDWLRSSLLRCLAVHKSTQFQTNPKATLKIIFPTVQNVLNGYFGPDSGGCLPYSKQINEKQRWLQNYLHQWKADGLNRSRAMPHIKTYCRVSPCLKKLAWFLLTSANLSKSAWGSGLQQKTNASYVRSYEVGVLFLPKYFNQEYFEMQQSTLNCKTAQLFPFIYDLPLTPYGSDDYPWCN